ncbi:ANTAR domain-containing protein [Blastococcus sp. LR1]|uniref:ANTAR domain-containing protein n=1 Tax=Blastococcus sp. LR1 TaxID=2877000 RepID=UPI001CCF5822|nr:ANTAR domain-containing protein [Blastococcus sp. LR1]MCA0146313.1 ANTAR domain-containing protein [Blastococcus sp. LR1]
MIPVSAPVSGELVADVVEGMTLADLVAEAVGGLPEPDRDTRRSARGPAGPAADADPVDARIAALERTIAQLEHALAARVSTERAIGVLAERDGSSPRTAFEELRRQARTQGRPVVELAREVLDGLATDPAPQAVAAALASPGVASALVPRPQPAVRSAVIADGRS